MSECNGCHCACKCGVVGNIISIHEAWTEEFMNIATTQALDLGKQSIYLILIKRRKTILFLGIRCFLNIIITSGLLPLSVSLMFLSYN